MMTDCNKIARQADQADHYYKCSFGIGAYFKNFAQKKFRSGPESVGVSKKNQDNFFNLGYMHLRMSHQQWSNLGQLELVLG